MACKLDKKVVVITGGASGIGYAIADNFLKQKVAKLIIVDINEKLGLTALDTLRRAHSQQAVEFYKGDVVNDLDDLFQKLIEKVTKVDVLVNCAGIGEDKLVEKTININTTAVIKWSLKFFEHMRCDKTGKGGTIINIASILAYRIVPYAPVYQASKFAVLGFTKSLGSAINFNRFGVRVVAICPGFTESDLIKNSAAHIIELQSDFLNSIKNISFQKADVVGKATVDVFETADSGTVWEIDSPKSLVLIS